MEAEDRRMLIEIHGAAKASEVKLDALMESHRSLDERQRSMEIRSAEHEIKITRINQDLDGVGRKMRAMQDNYVKTGIVSAEKPGGWKHIAVGVVEAVVELPRWGHVLITLGGGVFVFIMYIARHLHP